MTKQKSISATERANQPAPNAMHKGRPPFVVDYRHKGKDYSTTIGGDSWEEAEQHIRSLGTNGRIVGSDASIIPAPKLFSGPVALLVMLGVWLRNICLRRM